MSFFRTLRDIWGFVRARRKWWLAPIIAFLLFFSLVMVVSEGMGIAPLIYAMF